MRHAAFLALACHIALAGFAQSNATFQPDLIYAGDDAALCDDFTDRVRLDSLSGNSDASERVDRFEPAARYTDLLGLNIVHAPYHVTIDETLFAGDVDGDGTRDVLLTTMHGGQRAVAYQVFVLFTRLTEAEHRSARRQATERPFRRRNWKLGTFLSKARNLGITAGTYPMRPEIVSRPQEILYPRDIQSIVERVLSFPEPLQIIEHNDRLYVDQPAISPRHPLASAVRALVSFNTNMRARVECMVSTAPRAKTEQDE